MKTLHTIVLVLLFVISQQSFGQSNPEIAVKKAREAIKLMDNGKYEESISLLKEAQELDPDRFVYPYEIAYAQYLQKDYKGASERLEKISTHKDVSERFFQLLGNCYDYMGVSEKAFAIYDQGLKKFPKSGMLLMEKGNIHLIKKEYDKALPYFEQGIAADPMFASNYYRAAMLYCASSERIWGVLYGEIFMNLESNSKRTEDMSRLLYDTYKASIKITSDTTGSAEFSKHILNISQPDGAKFQIAYELTMSLSIAFNILSKNTSLNLSSLNTIRHSFITNWFSRKHDKDIPNVLFDYNQELMKAGHFEAYNYWLLMKGNEAEFTAWKEANTTKWDSFVEWYNAHLLYLDDTHKVTSGR
jgi:tetratricopeptide (TPR) repeat protein